MRPHMHSTDIGWTGFTKLRILVSSSGRQRESSQERTEKTRDKKECPVKARGCVCLVHFCTPSMESSALQISQFHAFAKEYIRGRKEWIGGEQKSRAESCIHFFLKAYYIFLNGLRDEKILFKMFSSSDIPAFLFLPEAAFFRRGISGGPCPGSDALCREDIYWCSMYKSGALLENKFWIENQALLKWISCDLRPSP